MRVFSSALNLLCRAGVALVLLSAIPALAAGAINLGSKNFTEQHVLGSITEQYLASMGYKIHRITDLASIIMRNALVNKQLDMVWEYTGTGLIVYHHINKRLSAQEGYDTIKQLDAKEGLVWLNPAPLNNTYALAMKRSTAEAFGIKTVSDLVKKMDAVAADPKAPLWQIALDMEFAGRPDGLIPMEQKYKLKLKRSQIRKMDSGLVYDAIRDGFVNAGMIYTTDGRVKGFDLLVLEDDLHYFPNYAATPVIRAEILAKYPELAHAMNKLSALLDNATVSGLNAKVDIEHRSVDKVAAEFLHEHQLIQ